MDVIRTRKYGWAGCSILNGTGGGKGEVGI